MLLGLCRLRRAWAVGPGLGRNDAGIREEGHLIPTDGGWNRVIVGHAARDPVARPDARFSFGPAQTRPGLVHFVPGLARPVFRARAWAGTPARGPARS